MNKELEEKMKKELEREIAEELEEYLIEETLLINNTPILEDPLTLEECWDNLVNDLDSCNCRSIQPGNTEINFSEQPCEDTNVIHFRGSTIVEDELYFIYGTVFNPKEKPEKLVELYNINGPWVKKGE